MIRRFAFAALILGAVACGDDGDDKPADTTKKDAAVGTTPDAAAPAPYVPTPNKVTNVGAACSASTPCMGEKPECQTSQSFVIASITYPKGFCTATCQQDNECVGTNAVCPLGPLVAMIPAGGGGQALPINPADASKCQQKCTADSECRVADGYKCQTLAQAFPTIAPLLTGLLTAQAGDAGAGGELTAGLSQTFCFPAPPAPAVDGGTATDAGATDAGATDAAATGDAAAGDAGTADAS